MDWVLTSENISIIVISVFYFLTFIGAWGFLNGVGAKKKKAEEILILNDNKKIHCAVLRNFNDVILIKNAKSYMFIFKLDIRIIRYLKEKDKRIK